MRATANQVNTHIIISVSLASEDNFIAILRHPKAAVVDRFDGDKAEPTLCLSHEIFSHMVASWSYGGSKIYN